MKEANPVQDGLAIGRFPYLDSTTGRGHKEATGEKKKEKKKSSAAMATVSVRTGI